MYRPSFTQHRSKCFKKKRFHSFYALRTPLGYPLFSAWVPFVESFLPFLMHYSVFLVISGSVLDFLAYLISWRPCPFLMTKWWGIWILALCNREQVAFPQCGRTKWAALSWIEDFIFEVSALHCQFSKPNHLRTLISKRNSRVFEQDLKNPNLNIPEAIRLRIQLFPYYVSSLGSFPSLKHLRYLHCNQRMLP